MKRRLLCLLLGIMVCWLGAPRAMAGSAQAVAILPAHGESGDALEMRFILLLREAFTRDGQAVMQTGVAASLKHAHVKMQKLRRPKELRRYARANHVGHILLVEAGNDPTVTTVLLNANGKELGRWPKLKPNANGAKTVEQGVLAALGGGASAPAPAAEKPLKVAPAPEEAVEDVESVPEAGAEEAHLKSTVRGEHGEGWRPAFRLHGGLMFLQRNAHLSPQPAMPNINTPCYCGTGRNANPFFPAFNIAAEFFPLAIGGHGGAVEGIGLNLQLFATQVHTVVDANKTQSIASTVFGLEAALTYRWVFLQSALSPDLYINAGLKEFSFPLGAGAFPGVSYTAPLVGAALHVPLGMEELVGVLGLAILPKVSAGSVAATQLGAQSGGGFGLDVDFGLRFAFDRWEIHVMGRYAYYNVPFTGTASLPLSDSTLPEPQNVVLTENLLQLFATTGFVF